MHPDTLSFGDLQLVPPTAAHVDAITNACQDTEIARWTAVPHPYTHQEAADFVSARAARAWAEGGALWVIQRRGDFAGVVGLEHTNQQGAEIGYWLAAAHRGQGVLAAALPLVLDHGFQQLGLRRIGWAAAEGNWASWRAVWRHGFVREGTRRRAFPDNTNPAAPHRNLWVGSLLAGEPRLPRTAWDGPALRADGGVLPAIPDPRDPEALVRQFHATYHLPVATGEPNVDFERIHMRMALIAEEFAELMGAVYGPAAEARVTAAVADAVAHDERTRDTVEAADALADLIYVIYGMALETGIPLDAVLHAVQRSNLSKLGADGKPIYREDGKVLKGPGFFHPNVADVLRDVRLAPSPAED